MTPAELSTWLEEVGGDGRTRLRQLVDIAFYGDPRQRISGTFKDGPKYTTIDGVQVENDRGQAAAEDAVQGALAMSLAGRAFYQLEAHKVWPFLVDAMRSRLMVARRTERRAKKARKEAVGTFIDTRGTWKQPAVAWTKDGATRHLTERQVNMPLSVQEEDQDDYEHGHNFQGPRGVGRGEYTVAPNGWCTCGERQTTRLEHGFDGERNGYSRTRTTEQLARLEDTVKDEPEGSIYRLAAFAVGCVVVQSTLESEEYLHVVDGCHNGHRAYDDVVLPKTRRGK